MTEQTLYRIELRGHEHEQKKSDHFYKPEEEVIAQLESIRNNTGNVDHLDIYTTESPDSPILAVAWLHERGLPLTYAHFLRENPPAHARALLVETRRWLHHQRIHHHMKLEQLRREHQPYIRVQPNPPLEGRIVAMEGLIAWMDQEIKELSKADRQLTYPTPQHRPERGSPPPGSRALFCLHERRTA